MAEIDRRAAVGAHVDVTLVAVVESIVEAIFADPPAALAAPRELPFFDALGAHLIETARAICALRTAAAEVVLARQTRDALQIAVAAKAPESRRARVSPRAIVSGSEGVSDL